MILLKYIRRADILVKPFQFNIHNRKRTQTLIGGIFSIFLFVTYILYGISLYNRQEFNQNTIYAGSQSDFQEDYSLNQSIVKFAIEISPIQSEPFKNYSYIQQYLNLDVFYIDQRRVSEVVGYNRNQTKLTIKKCDTAYIEEFNFQNATLTESQKEQLLCFEGQFNISGQFYDPIFQYVKIQLNICDLKSNPSCKSIKEIEDFISQGINIDLFIKGDKVKKALNLSDPAETYPKNMYWRLTTGIANNEDIYMAPISLDIKKNSLFEKLTSQGPNKNIFKSAAIFKSERRQESIIFQHGALMNSFYLRAGSESFYYFCNQSDWLVILLSSISETTSLIVTFLRILQFFYGFYNKHKTFETLMNNVFKFDITKNTRTDIDEIQTSGINNINIQNVLIKKQKLEKVFLYLFQIINFTIQYPIWRYILYKLSKLFLCLKKLNICQIAQEETITISQLAKNKIQNDLDLTNILKKLYEIDCLKLLLFDDDQLLIFNSFSSPVFQDNMVQKQHFKEIVKQQSIRKQLRKQTFSKVDFKFVNSQKINITQKLNKLSRFFIAQMLPNDAEELTMIFRRIQEDQNMNFKKNKKLLKFAQINYTLYKLVQQYCQASQNITIEKKTHEALSLEGEDRHNVQSIQIHMRTLNK
ncbi:unnamed protein product [Paramecium sonneborni]|uniref:Transmembrane protein n=1 Tax=Paramecium sonneborni TaxID=65129 RepID=A0A8S1MYZ6_9CILI|nr:unnamed protein product [Paramecium sonneborni]